MQRIESGEEVFNIEIDAEAGVIAADFKTK
jgi:hypothetical protein